MALNAMKFHISLNVSNLPRSLAFYRVLFGLEPAKCHDDYAKFELTEPPVVFSLVPQPSLTGGSLSRIGLRFGEPAAVAEIKARLEANGLTIQIPSGCCSATLRKCYVADPDLNLWEIASGEDDDSAAPAAPAAPSTSLRLLPVVAAAESVVWEHFVTAPPSERIPHGDGAVDEVRLTGSFNGSLDAGQVGALLREARRVLRLGGKVVVHGLCGDRPFANGQPQLPGLAAMVSRVPVHTEALDALCAAGFVGVHFVKFTEKPWFVIDGVELREVKLLALQPEITEAQRQVLYRGPFREAVDDAGRVYPRGQYVRVSAAVAAALHDGPAAEQFLFVKPDAAGCCGG
ncbi:MAG: VOC family protein [Planctomycetia bacterium]|nr:VOC family protein [Planctomycetia bacterium]